MTAAQPLSRKAAGTVPEIHSNSLHPFISGRKKRILPDIDPGSVV
jgi:hypothetical protein